MKSIDELVDRAPVRRFHWLIVTAGFLVMMIDGYDLVAMGLVVPSLSHDWGLDPAGFAVALSAALVGVLFGSSVGGMLGDAIGRRRTLVLMLLVAGVSMLASAGVSGPVSMSAWRFVTGFGAGGCIPVAIAYTSEFMPARLRNTLTVVMYSGTAMGGVVGGLAGADLIEAAGWQGIFVAGGVLSILAALVCAWLLPESVKYLLQRREGTERALAILRRIEPGVDAGNVCLSPPATGSRLPRVGLAALFDGPLREVTLIVWVAFLANQAIVFFVASWLPTLLTRGGLSLQASLYMVALYSCGGLVGGAIFGMAGDRFDPLRTLTITFSLAAACIVALGLSVTLPPALVAAVVLTGVSLLGSSLLLGATTASMYPTAVRASGLGWALGIGRLGAVAGPLLGGLALGAGLSVSGILVTAAVIPVVAGASVALLRRRLRGTAAAQ